jgi:hypothetical protein
MSIVILFSAVETSLLNWTLCGVWSCMQHLHVLVPSSRSLKIVDVFDHSALWSCIALFFGWMDPLLELLLDMVELTWQLGVDVATVVTSGWYC